MVREIDAREITSTVSRLFQEACYILPDDVLNALKRARQSEESPVGCEVLDTILRNADISAKEQVPLCQLVGSRLHLQVFQQRPGDLLHGILFFLIVIMDGQEHS